MKKIVHILLILFFAFMVHLEPTRAVSRNQESSLLFIPVTVPPVFRAVASPAALRCRYVEINFGLLDQIETGDYLELNLFEDTGYTAVIDKVERAENGSTLWKGELVAIKPGQFLLVAQKGLLAGIITVPGSVFEVVYADYGIHRVQEIDQTLYPPEGEPIEVEIEGDTSTALPALPADDGSVIRVMVVYTPAVTSAAGGVTAVQNLINLAVAETNQSYANSGISQRLHLAYTGEISYTESGDMSSDLNRLRISGDGFMDAVHTLRNDYSADIVTLIEESSEYCGIAYMMSQVSVLFESYAFNVVARNCAVGYFSFGHELGHNMGARHDWFVDATSGSPYSFNKGFVNLQDRWRTIMAYNSDCAARGFNCTRLQYWSNPDIFYGGDRMGVPAGTSIACSVNNLNNPLCDADNRSTLNNTAYTVANFRSGGTVGTVGPIVYYNHTVDDDSSGNSVGDGDHVPECGETIELWVSLRNSGTQSAIGVNGTINENSAYLSGPIYNNSSSYPDIPDGAVRTNTDDFDYAISLNTPDGHVVGFTLEITASNGGPWQVQFNFPVSCIPVPGNFDIFLPLVSG